MGFYENIIEFYKICFLYFSPKEISLRALKYFFQHFIHYSSYFKSAEKFNKVSTQPTSPSGPTLKNWD